MSNAKFDKLIAAMQRTQSSYSKQKRACAEKRDFSNADACEAVVSVLSDLIRLAAELRAGDGEQPTCVCEDATLRSLREVMEGECRTCGRKIAP